MLINPDEQKLMEETRVTLNRVKDSNKKLGVTLFQTLEDASKKFDRGKIFFEEYDPLNYEGKIKVDMLYYKQLLQKLDETVTPQVETLLIELYKDIKEIYEFINIRPEIYGRGITVEILNDSIESACSKLSKVIYDHLDRTFYSLTADQRKARYYEPHVDIAKSLIEEGTQPVEAISYAVKVLVMEDLVRNISFPFASWSRLQYLVNNEDYGAIFDQDKLINLVESFDKKVRGVAKVIAACI